MLKSDQSQSVSDCTCVWRPLDFWWISKSEHTTHNYSSSSDGSISEITLDLVNNPSRVSLFCKQSLGQNAHLWDILRWWAAVVHEGTGNQFSSIGKHLCTLPLVPNSKAKFKEQKRGNSSPADSKLNFRRMWARLCQRNSVNWRVCLLPCLVRKGLSSRPRYPSFLFRELRIINPHHPGVLLAHTQGQRDPEVRAASEEGGR